MNGDDPMSGAAAGGTLLHQAVEKHRAGALDAAIELYREVLKSGALSDDDIAETEARRLLGAALQEQGRAAEAIDVLHAVTPLTSDSVLGHATLGDAHRALDQLDRAIAHFRRLVELAPDIIDAQINLGVCLQETGDVTGAIARYRVALEIDPNSGAAATNLGLALLETGDVDGAVAPLERGVALDSGALNGLGDSVALNGLGAVYLRLGRTEDAEHVIRRAIDAAPDYAPAWSNLGNVHQDYQRLDDALAAHDKSVSLDPDNAEAHWNRAMTLLLSGDLKRGFEEYEWRRQTRNHAPPGHGSPLWDGGDPRDKHMLLLAEQGFGDMIQFARYAPVLAARGAQVTLACPPKLVELFGSLGGDISLVTNTGAARDVDCHAPLMSLPLLCGTAAAAVPAEIPYLAAPSGAPTGAAATPPPPSTDRCRVGLCWTGNPDHPDNPFRSCTLDAFAPLLGNTDIEWVSLQYGHGAAQSGPYSSQLSDWSEYLEGFANTAAALDALDLVITIDTSTAHLAGALGRPTWLLLKYTPDWRWMLDRDDSPWYSTMQLFRQTRAGCWDDVIARLEHRLKDWITE
jgi:tetratricopeptide (TPR) repeat protein